MNDDCSDATMCCRKFQCTSDSQCRNQGTCDTNTGQCKCPQGCAGVNCVVCEETGRFNIERDNYFVFQTTEIPNIVRAGISPTTADVTLVIRFATMLNLAR